METGLALDFNAPLPAQPAEEPKRRRGRPRGSLAEKSKQRLADAGVEVEDPNRPTDGRRRKPAGVEVGPGLRDGPGLPLRNRGYDAVARLVSAGLPDLDAWVQSGYSPHNRAWLDVMRHPDFIERVREYRESDQQAVPISLTFLQRRLMMIATSDPANYFEPIPHSSGRFRTKNILDLPPEVRASIAEVNFDKNGRAIIRLHDRTKAIETLMKTLGAFAPSEPSLQVNLIEGMSIDQQRLMADAMRVISDPAVGKALIENVHAFPDGVVEPDPEKPPGEM